MGIIVTKFGGSSLADAAQFRKVKEILARDARRAYVVPSAPGKRFPGDDKVTDLLYACHRQAAAGEIFSDTYDKIRARYRGILAELALDMEVETELDEIERAIENGASADYTASRGEYLCGKILAVYLESEFVDAAEVVCFAADGQLDDEKTDQRMKSRLQGVARAVIPGFYGTAPDGAIRTFSRGGSDITGAIVSRAIGAEMYENWTDVSGFLMADPRIVKDAKEIASITYQELRELSYMGASVLHENSVFPVRAAGIPTNIRNTNKPEHPGTLITRREKAPDRGEHTITGIAGHKGFSIISVEKAMMNAELGFGRKVLQALEEKNIPFEHLPTGIDTMCVVVREDLLRPHRAEVIARITELTQPDSVTIHDGMSVIATVGRGMVHNCGTAARLFGAMSRAGINVRMIDQGSSELSILVGVDDADFDRTVTAIYDEFVR